ncbi:hypothetical protein EV667_1973 [Ancylobacter aquaticus]|uniref:Uncharacterized protein n=1 Tax=Ancylobacter aquaticus TaxID=100 RepID=A0A4R1HYT9_ANCAQ|nr:hypothetical protein [Ancylobacter aquaticus]TCK27977.1 hypothetical protein EV667_1973 [Ancylobacter aquaticus]
MSAMLAVVQSDRVHVMADAATYDPADGVVTAFRHKIVPLPMANAVFSLRGITGCFREFYKACLLADIEGFDGFRRAADDVWETFEAGLPEGMDCEIIVAGWSDQHARGEVFYRCTDTVHDNLPAGCWFVLGNRCAFGVDLDDIPEDSVFDPVEHGVPAFERARAHIDDLSCGRGEPVMGHGVGGWVSHVEIVPGLMPDGDVLHVWPDVVGEKIAPEGVIVGDIGVAA